MSLTVGPEPVPLRVDADGVARVGCTRVSLDSVAWAFRSGETPEGIAEQFPTLALADVYSVLGWYLRHRAEADAYLAEREVEAARLREEVEADFPPTGLRGRLLARRGACRTEEDGAR